MVKSTLGKDNPDMRNKVWSIAIAVMAVSIFCGCVTQSSVLTAGKTPPAFGNIKLYGTDNVPFEYEEIGVFSYMHVRGDQDEALKCYAEQVRGVGAEAVLNFRIRRVMFVQSIFGFGVISNASQFEMEGVAVKIKRP